MRSGFGGFRSSLALLSVGLACTLNACQTWHREPIGPSLDGLRPRDEVQLWIAGHVHEVHGVVLRGDSVSAVPRWQSLECASCALHFAFRSIDSVRVHTHSGEHTQRLGQGVLVALVALVVSLLAFTGIQFW